MKPRRTPKKRAKQVKPAKKQEWRHYGHLVFTCIKPGTVMTDELMKTLTMEADIHGDHLGVIIVPAIDMRMNIQGEYQNCVFVTQANSQRLLETLDSGLEKICDELSVRSGLRAKAILQLRNSSEILTICLNQKQSKKPKKDTDEESSSPRHRHHRYRPSGQSDPNTSYQIPDLRKYKEEEEDFRGHHDHTG